MSDQKPPTGLRSAGKRLWTAVIEADQRFRASLPPGLPASAIPDGVTYGDLVRQAAKDARPKRESVLEHALSHPGGGVVYHELPRGEE